MIDSESGLGVGTVVAPAERPRKQREAARVVVLTDDDRVLLTERFDPGLPGSGWWSTPGGGIDPGELPAAAAVRELWEETGQRFGIHQLIGPVLRRVVIHGYTDQIARQAELFYLLRVPRSFVVAPAVVTPRERVSTRESRWWPRAELAGTSEWIWDPVERVIEVADSCAPWPVVLDEVELSTVSSDA